VTVPTLAPQTTATIAAHLAADHRVTGISPAEIATTDPVELLRWHDVDHHYCSTAFLGHEHQVGAAAKVVHEDPGRAIHAQNLRRIREGGTIPDLEQILDRARSAAIRQAAARHDPVTGARVPGAGCVSQVDRDAMEIAEALAQRSAARVHRKGGRAA